MTPGLLHKSLSAIPNFAHKETTCAVERRNKKCTTKAGVTSIRTKLSQQQSTHPAADAHRDGMDANLTYL